MRHGIGERVEGSAEANLRFRLVDTHTHKSPTPTNHKLVDTMQELYQFSESVVFLIDQISSIIAQNIVYAPLFLRDTTSHICLFKTISNCS